MQQIKRQERTAEYRWPRSASHALALAVISMACFGITDEAQAKSGKLGVYAGTVAVSGTETVNRGKETYHADVKISLPLTDGNERSAMAEISDVDKPSATALFAQWEVNGKETVPDERDGKLDTWHCSLAAPTEVPMNVSGALTLDYSKKTYSMSFAMVSVMKQIPLKCTHSRTGAYKQDRSVSLVIGTTVMGEQFVELPYTDPARLAATYKLMPPKDTEFGPVDMVWDMRLTH